MGMNLHPSVLHHQASFKHQIICGLLQSFFGDHPLLSVIKLLPPSSRSCASCLAMRHAGRQKYQTVNFQYSSFQNFSCFVGKTRSNNEMGKGELQTARNTQVQTNLLLLQQVLHTIPGYLSAVILPVPNKACHSSPKAGYPSHSYLLGSCSCPTHIWVISSQHCSLFLKPLH